MPMTTAHDEEAAHRRRAFLHVVALRAVLADPLAEPERVQDADVRRHQDDHQGEREEQALDQLDLGELARHRAAPVAELAPEAVDDRIEPDPARRLDQDDVAVAQPRRQGGERGVGVARRGGWPSRSRPAASAPSAIPAAPAPTTISQSTRPRRPPHRPRDDPRRWRRRARASRRGPRRADLAARRAGRARRRRTAATRCTLSSTTRHRPETDDRHPMRRRPAVRRGRPRSRRASGRRARPTAAAASALWTDSRPSAGIVTGRREPSARSMKRIPSRPSDSTASAPTSASAANP